jgi:hypothetical protein
MDEKFWPQRISIAERIISSFTSMRHCVFDRCLSPRISDEALCFQEPAGAMQLDAAKHNVSSAISRFVANYPGKLLEI